MKIKTIILLFGAFLATQGFSANVSQGFSVTAESNNQGIKIVNPVNTEAVCYASPGPISINLPVQFSAEQLNSKQFQPCQDSSGNAIYFGVMITGASGILSKTFAIQPGQNCQLKYHWLSSGWQMTC